MKQASVCGDFLMPELTRAMPLVRRHYADALLETVLDCFSLGLALPVANG